MKKNKPNKQFSTKTTSGLSKGKESIEKSSEFAFTRKNYKLLLIGLGFILVGFILMVGGGSDDPNVFSEDLFSFQRITLAPILIITGYVIEIFAIMKRPKD